MHHCPTCDRLSSPNSLPLEDLTVAARVLPVPDGIPNTSSHHRLLSHQHHPSRAHQDPSHPFHPLSWFTSAITRMSGLPGLSVLILTLIPISSAWPLSGLISYFPHSWKLSVCPWQPWFIHKIPCKFSFFSELFPHLLALMETQDAAFPADFSPGGEGDVLLRSHCPLPWKPITLTSHPHVVAVILDPWVTPVPPRRFQSPEDCYSLQGCPSLQGQLHGVHSVPLQRDSHFRGTCTWFNALLSLSWNS